MDHDEEEQNDNGAAEEETAENVIQIGPKRRPRAVTEPETVAVPLHAFGAVPETATYWACHKAGLGGTYDVQSWGEPGKSVELREWPLAELSEEEIRRRWGAGSYRLQWLKATPQGGRKSIAYGRVFTLRAESPAAAPVAAPASPLGASFDLAMQVMASIEKQASAKVDSMLRMAEVMGSGGRGGGLGAAELELILTKQAASMQGLVAAAVAPLQAEVVALRARVDDEGDDDDDDGINVGAVASAAAPFIKGKGTLATVANVVIANPELLKHAAPVASVLADAIVKLGSLFTTTAAAAAPPAASAPPPAPPMPVRPRAVAEAVYEPEPAVDNSSLSSWVSTPPAPSAPPAVTDEAAAQ